MPCRPAASSILRKSASASGLRQVFPEQTKSTRMRTSGSQTPDGPPQFRARQRAFADQRGDRTGTVYHGRWRHVTQGSAVEDQQLAALDLRLKDRGDLLGTG